MDCITQQWMDSGSQSLIYVKSRTTRFFLLHTLMNASILLSVNALLHQQKVVLSAQSAQ
ncbi:MAG: hypothetical protein SPE03_13225 [Treponema sp.]|nr:hypothetical protein [Treponema sp.]